MTKFKRRAWLSVAGVAALIAAAGACASRPPLLPVSLPDLSRADPAVQMQARDQYASLTQKIAARGTPADELGAAYGRMGMILQAADYYDAAEPCYLDAQALVPGDRHWPYYLGHLYSSRGETEKAEAAFRRVLELPPDDFPTLVYLGRLYLDNGRPGDAEPLFARALTLSPRAVAAMAGLGRAALAKRDFARAAQQLEEALAIDPQAESLHSPLAIAYRGLGQIEKAAPHLQKWRNREILVVDPLMQELSLVLESGLSYELRGVRALEAKDWKAAAAFFRKGTELARGDTPLGRSLHHKLGTALFMQGQTDAAREQFEQVVRMAPQSGVDESTAKAHYSLAVLTASSGQGAGSIEHFSAAVKYQPNYVEALLGLADALRRDGRAADSLAQYQEALKLDPRAPSARLGYAIALMRLRRYRAAREWLTEATAHYPDQPEFALALARLLSAAPDDSVRDGRRALALVEELFKSHKSTDVGEAMAMTLAELGEYERAAGIQRGVMAAATRAGSNDVVLRRMEGTLRLYDQGRPSRTPWPDD